MESFRRKKSQNNLYAKHHHCAWKKFRKKKLKISVLDVVFFLHYFHAPTCSPRRQTGAILESNFSHIFFYVLIPTSHKQMCCVKTLYKWKVLCVKPYIHYNSGYCYIRDGRGGRVSSGGCTALSSRRLFAVGHFDPHHGCIDSL